MTPRPERVDAVVLVGGQGTRLRPLTLTTPKPMLPAAGVPFLAHPLAGLRDAGITHVVLSTSYRAEVFAGHFGDGSSYGLQIDYVTEETPLGTAGGLRNVADRLQGDDVVVLNGDILSGLDVAALVAAHRAADADVTLHLTTVDDPRAFGSVPTDDSGWVTAFLEKSPEPVTNQVNAGCYVFRRAVVDAIPAGRAVSVERETFPGLLADGARVLGHVERSYWLDLGTPAAFVRGSCDLVTGVAPSSAVPGPRGETLVVGGADVDGTALLCGGTTVDSGCVVGAGARVESSVLLPGASVGEGAVVVRSVVGAGAAVGDGVVLEDAVIGDGAVVAAGNELRAGARVWPGVVLPPTAVRFSADV